MKKLDKQIREYAAAEAQTPGNTEAFPPNTTHEQALAMLEQSAIDDLIKLKAKLDATTGRAVIPALESIIIVAKQRGFATKSTFIKVGFNEEAAQALEDVAESRIGYSAILDIL